MSQYLTLEQFLDTRHEKAGQDFESTFWVPRDANGAPLMGPDGKTPLTGKVQVRFATVGDKEAARQEARKADEKKFDNALYGCHLIHLCMLQPQIPALEVIRLREKDAAEMDRLLAFITRDDKANPR